MRSSMIEYFQAEKQEALLFLAVGVGLIAQAAFKLVLDLFAAQRGRAYLEALARLG